MTKRPRYPRSLSRRDTLKICIVPATAAITGRWLTGCSAADDGGDPLAAMPTGDAVDQSSSVMQAATSGSGAATPPSVASGPSASAGSAPSASGTAGATSAGGAGNGTATSSSMQASAGAPASSSSGAAGSGGSAGTAATSGGAGAPATSAGSNAMAQAGAGGSTSMSTVAGPNVMWATGGTAMMAATYPDPFEMGAGTACKLYPSQTLGPCYAQDPMMRSDISDGLDGLPVRLSFLVVGADGCTPIPNATVDIWHSGSQGIYSAYATGTTCNPGADNVLDDMFCRGVQAVDETGRINFSTVFPGWYMGRTIHIHFTVRVSGRETVTSQLYFEDELVDEILGQGYYKARGKRDTNNARDGIFRSGGATPEQVIMDTVKRPDGILHAWKVLSIG